MLNSIPMEVRTLGQVSPCWLYENRVYRYMVDGFERESLLPTVDKECLPVLQEMGIPYRAVGEKYEYWKEGNFKETEMRLPLYRREGRQTYKFVKNYTSTVVTDETIKAAFALCTDVEKQIEAFKLEKKKKETIQYLKKLLAGNVAVGVDLILDPVLTKKEHCKLLDFITANDHIRIFPVMALMNPARMDMWRSYCWDLMMDEDEIDYTVDTNYIAIFDMTKIHKDEIEIKVPIGKKGLYIGRQAWQLKKWSRSIGVRRINVSEAEE